MSANICLETQHLYHNFQLEQLVVMIMQIRQVRVNVGVAGEQSIFAQCTHQLHYCIHAQRRLVFGPGHGVLALSATARKFLSSCSTICMPYNSLMHCMQLTVFQHVQRANPSQYNMLVVM